MDAIERRVAWIAITVGIVLGFAVTGGYGLGGTRGTWELTFYIVVLVALGIAATLLVAALLPASIRPLLLEQRDRLAFYAFALWALAIVITLALGIHVAVEAHRHPNGFG